MKCTVGRSEFNRIDLIIFQILITVSLRCWKYFCNFTTTANNNINKSFTYFKPTTPQYTFNEVYASPMKLYWVHYNDTSLAT